MFASTWAASDMLVFGVLSAGLGLAAAIDIKSRRIPNELSLSLACLGVVLAGTGASGISIAASLIGCVVAVLLMLPGHVLGATGAGDVKLFGAAGAVIGAGRVFEAFVCVAIAGGVLALAIACVRGRLGRTVLQTCRLLRRPSEARAVIEAPGENNRFAYGPAIAVGVMLAVGLRP
jgi:prepilin peptidase CpaA